VLGAHASGTRFVPAAGCCVCGNELSDSVSGGKRLEQLKDFQLLKNHIATCS
jgi:hypothetical protein